MVVSDKLNVLEVCHLWSFTNMSIRYWQLFIMEFLRNISDTYCMLKIFIVDIHVHPASRCGWAQYSVYLVNVPCQVYSVNYPIVSCYSRFALIMAPLPVHKELVLHISKKIRKHVTTRKRCDGKRMHELYTLFQDRKYGTICRRTTGTVLKYVNVSSSNTEGKECM
jgi:hypothetical protein